MSDTPDWLRTSTPAAETTTTTSNWGTTSAPAPTASTTAAPVAASTTNASAAEAANPELPGIILTMRLANMGVAIALIVVSILQIIGFRDISVIVLACYATFGGLLVCCLETQLKFLRVMIAVNFGFLFNSAWRFMYYVLLASLAYSYDNLRGRIVAIALGVCALFNTYVLCAYPSYRALRDKIAEEEDKRIEARISKEVKRQVARQIVK